jgi:hypothetical protein
MERRDVVGGGLAAGLVALMGTDAEAAGAAQRDNSEAVSRAVDELRQAIQGNYSNPWRVIAQVREQQRIFMRQNYRYPEFIDVGIDVWDALYDWHVRFQQQVEMRRIQDGRYAMSFTFTTFILRPDMIPGYIGMPYDNNTDIVKPPL